MQRLHLVVTATLAGAVVVLGVLLWRAGRTSGAPSTHAAAPLTADDETSVQAVVSEFASTWNRHDMKAMHELNTGDVEWVNVTANHWRGNPAVLKGHAAIHRTIFAKTSMTVEKTSVRAIDPNTAIAVATMKFGPVPMPSGQVLPELRTRGSFIVVRRDGIWKIAHFQNTTIDADAERNDPITWGEKGFVPAKKDGGKLEQEVRRIDQSEAAAVLVGDIPTIEKLWAEEFTANAPNNQILKGQKDAIELVKDGILDYASFERAVEAVLVHGDTVIIMGEETVKPRGKAPFAGHTIRRRITNIWMKRDSQWQLTARQATIISKE